MSSASMYKSRPMIMGVIVLPQHRKNRRTRNFVFSFIHGSFGFRPRRRRQNLLRLFFELLQLCFSCEGLLAHELQRVAKGAANTNFLLTGEGRERGGIFC